MAILADSKGKTADGGELARRLAGMGYGVLALDLRGTGETRITRRSERDAEGAFEAQVLGVEAGVAYDGLRLGRPIFTMRVYDLLKTAEYLRTRPEVDTANIGLIGRNSCGMPALYAAALDKGLKGVLADSAMASFSELVTAKIYTWNFMDFLPGPALPRPAAGRRVARAQGALGEQPAGCRKTCAGPLQRRTELRLDHRRVQES